MHEVLSPFEVWLYCSKTPLNLPREEIITAGIFTAFWTTEELCALVFLGFCEFNINLSSLFYLFQSTFSHCLVEAAEQHMCHVFATHASKVKCESPLHICCPNIWSSMSLCQLFGFLESAMNCCRNWDLGYLVLLAWKIKFSFRREREKEREKLMYFLYVKWGATAWEAMAPRQSKSDWEVSWHPPLERGSEKNTERQFMSLPAEWMKECMNW